MATVQKNYSNLRRVAFIAIATLFVSSCSLSRVLNQQAEDVSDHNGRLALATLVRVIEVVGGSASLPEPEDVETSWTQARSISNHMLGSQIFSSEPSEIWRYDASGPMSRGRVPSMEPLIKENRVYFISWDMRVHSIDLGTGELFWETDLGKEAEAGAFGGGLAMNSGTIYAATGLGEVNALNASTGEIKWTVNLNVPVRSGPMLSDDHLIIADILGNITALDLLGGELWRITAPQSLTGISAANTPAGNDLGIFALRPDGVLTAILPSGLEAWQYDIGVQGTTGRLIDTISDSRALPVLDNDIILASSWADRTVALNPGTGQPLWNIPIGGAATPLLTDTYVFMVTKDGALRALERETGYQIWSTQLDGQPLDRRAKTLDWFGPLSAGGRLVLASNGGEILFVDPVSGGIQTRIDLESPVVAPLSLAQETLLVTTQDGTVRALK